MNMHTQIALPTTISDLIDEYDEKAASVETAMAAFYTAFTAMESAGTVHGTYVERVVEKPYLHAESLRKGLLKSGWQAIYNRLQIDAVASANDKRLFEKTLTDPPALTRESVYSTFKDYYERPRFHILRGLAEAFCSLDPAYKSHSKVKIGVKGLPKRVILNGWGEYSTGYARDRFRDMVNALAAVRGQVPFDWLEMLDIDDQHKAGGDATISHGETW